MSKPIQIILFWYISFFSDLYSAPIPSLSPHPSEDSPSFWKNCCRKPMLFPKRNTLHTPRILKCSFPLPSQGRREGGKGGMFPPPRNSAKLGKFGKIREKIGKNHRKCAKNEKVPPLKSGTREIFYKIF